MELGSFRHYDWGTQEERITSILQSLLNDMATMRLEDGVTFLLTTEGEFIVLEEDMDILEEHLELVRVQ